MPIFCVKSYGSSCPPTLKTSGKAVAGLAAMTALVIGILSLMHCCNLTGGSLALTDNIYLASGMIGGGVLALIALALCSCCNYGKTNTNLSKDEPLKKNTDGEPASVSKNISDVKIDSGRGSGGEGHGGPNHAQTQLDPSSSVNPNGGGGGGGAPGSPTGTSHAHTQAQAPGSDASLFED